MEIFKHILAVLKDYSIILQIIVNSIMSLVLVLIGYYFSVKKIKKQLKANITQDQLKHAIDHNNKLLQTSLDHYSGFRKNLYDKKLQTLDLIWKFFIEFNKTIPSGSGFKILMSLNRNDLIRFHNDEKIINLVKNENLFEVYKEQYGLIDPIIQSGYLINKDLYMIFEVYHTVIMRFIVLILGELFTSNPIFLWQDDKFIIENLRLVITEDELNAIYSDEELGTFNLALNLLKEKALNKIIHEITGEEESKNLLDHIKRLHNPEIQIKDPKIAEIYNAIKK